MNKQDIISHLSRLQSRRNELLAQLANIESNNIFERCQFSPANNPITGRSEAISASRACYEWQLRICNRALTYYTKMLAKQQMNYYNNK